MNRNYGVEFPNAGKVTSIVINRPSGASTNCNGITLNGEPLVDSIFSTQDTVLDTPMNNYAVLETGTNGNLVASADGTNVTYMGDAGVDYYYEADGTGAVHTGGTAFSSTSGVTYNFGQQPFAQEYDDSQAWSSVIVATGSSPLNGTLVDLFDGETSDLLSGIGVDTVSVDAQTITLSNFAFSNSTVTVYYSHNPSQSTINSIVVGDKSNTSPPAGPSGRSIKSITLTGCTGNDIIMTATKSGGDASNLIVGIEVDGNLLVDSDSAIGAAYSNNLYQTWLEWNDVATFLADNPAHVLTYQTIEAALESYEGNRDAFRTALRSRLIADGYLATEVEVLGL